MAEESQVSIIICSSPMVCATALLNENAFPEFVHSEATWAARRLAVFLRNASGVSGEIDNAAAAFLTHLRSNWLQYVAAVQRRPELEFVAYSDGLHYLAAMHSVLYELKAFLDLYARLLCKLISTDGGPVGFNKGKVEGVEISGGRLVNWINGFRTEVVPKGSELAHRICAASRDWITPAVDFRDTLGHFRELPGFRHMRVSVSHGPVAISLPDIQRPQMPDGQLLEEYGQSLADRLCQFVANTISLVPKVQTHLLVSWESAKEYLRDEKGV